MIKKIIIKDNTILSEILFFKEISFNQNVNLLFGGNGVGKSTLINAILEKSDNCEFEKNSNKVTMYSYINSIQNLKELSIKNKNLSYNDFFNPSIISKKFYAEELSEGQSIIYTMSEFFMLEKYLKENQDYLFVIDEIDSGLSVDNIEWVCLKIKEISENHKNVQFIISFNNFEFCNHFPSVINMYTGKEQIIQNY